MVTTPWYDYEIPMTQAAELGTRKVMEDHCSIGLVVTTDGSVTDIPRSDYIEAENRAIRDMQQTGKPFLVVINSRHPKSETARQVWEHIREQFGITPAILDAQQLDSSDVAQLLRQLLYCFPMKQLQVHMPRWVHSLDTSHPVKAALYQALLQRAGEISTLAQAEPVLSQLQQMEQILDFTIRKVDLGTGTVVCCLTFPESLFYEILSNTAGVPLQNDGQLLELLAELSAVKKEYDKLADAISAVNATGYGVVMPTAEQMTLQPPELLRKNGAFGLRLKAGAPSIHMIRVDIDTQISPMVGDEKQSRDLIDYLSGESPEKLWQSNIFGNSVYDMIQEGISAKLLQTPPEVREKFRGTLTRIVNEGAAGLFCLIL